MGMSESCWSLWLRFKAAVKALKMELLVIHYASLDPECGWLARVLITISIAYALSPMDLIPDFIPIIGLIDDFLLLPLMLYLARMSVPRPVLERARQRAENEPFRLPTSLVGAAFIGLSW